MQVSNAKIRTFRRCANKYRYKYPMKLRPKAKALPLEKGSWMHELLEVHYDGENWKTRHRELTQKFNNLWEEEREMLGDLPGECARLMRAYVRHYRYDEERYAVVDTELDEVITLPNGLRLNIVVDLIVEDVLEGGLWIWDHKFRASLGDADDMLLDPQLTMYFWGIEQMGYAPLRGAMYNEIRTKPPAIPELLKSGQLSQRMNIDTDVYTYMRAIRENELDPSHYADILRHIATREEGRFFKRTPIPKDPPVVKTMMKELVQTARKIQRAEDEGSYERTFDFTCKFQCEYKNLCIAELHGADISSMIKADYEVSRRNGKAK